MELLIGLGLLALAWVLFRALLRAIRRWRLMRKYGDAEIVRRIMRQTIWEGMTTEQLVDALGDPLDIDERLARRAVTRVYKYRKLGRRRFGTRVTLRDGRVIGWDVK